jgi:proline iminopeptidase
MPFMKPLTQDFTLIFYDQRGGGRSTLPADTALLQPLHFTEDLEAVRKHFSIGKLNLITHSFGSILVSNYLQNYPGHVERLVLHGPTGPVRLEMGEYYQAKAANASPPPDSSLAEEASRLLEGLLSGRSESPKSDCRRYEEINLKLAKMRGKHVGITGTSCEAPADAVSYYYEHTAQRAPSNYGMWNYIGKLDHIQIPVLIIHGIDDSLAAAIQKRWTEVYPNSHFEGIPKADKGALSQRPDTTLKLITDFFMKVG